MIRNANCSVCLTLPALGAVAVASALFTTSAAADEVDARRIFQSMSDYLGSQTALSFDYDATLDLVSQEGQTLSLASSGSVSLARPDKIMATRTGGFADVQMVFDGETLTFLGNRASAYVQVDIPGDIDNLVDTLRDKYGRPLPAADLLMSNVSDEILPLVEDVKDLGSGVIGGVECDHFAFRTADVDLQIWIAQGDSPYPCRYTINSKDVPGSPQYTIVVSDWKAGADVTSGDFKADIPAGATKIEPAGMADKLPENFTLLGDAK